jgi:hypothetical protein
MSFTFSHEVDVPNKLLICEVQGTINHAIDTEHMLKNIVKLAGKNQVKHVVLDVTQLVLAYSAVEMSTIMLRMHEQNWLADIKIARIVNPRDNNQNLVAGFSDKYALPIKNFEDRSAALMWLKFNI